MTEKLGDPKRVRVSQNAAIEAVVSEFFSFAFFLSSHCDVD
jgi:hypothetical protein